MKKTRHSQGHGYFIDIKEIKAVCTQSAETPDLFFPEGWPEAFTLKARYWGKSPQEMCSAQEERSMESHIRDSPYKFPIQKTPTPSSQMRSSNHMPIGPRCLFSRSLFFKSLTQTWVGTLTRMIETKQVKMEKLQGEENLQNLSSFSDKRKYCLHETRTGCHKKVTSRKYNRILEK